MPRKKPYGKRIAEARKASQWPTQAALARKFRVTVKTISDWELGNTVPSDRNQAKIANWLGVTK